ncbi:MAG: anaerobic sulfatase maturase [Myxococcales bacterium]|nr:anaerobic sulfatase maturase [Myxococcales bacterium]
MQKSSSSFQVMVKPRGPICNLACEYCYFRSKVELYEDSSFRMSDALLEQYTRDLIKAQDLPEVSFAWQGGEPTLMGLDFFRRARSLQEKYGRPGVRMTNSLQTNGVLLDDEWCRFLKREGFLVGISLDGPRALHDAYRVDGAGRPTFSRVMRAIALLQKHGVEFNVLTTVNAENVEHALEVYEFLRDQVGAPFLQFIPIVERRDTGEGADGIRVSERSVTGAGYGAFLNTIFDAWVRRDVGRVFVQIFDVSLAAWSGHNPGLCTFAERCGNALVLEHNGDLYSCDHFVDPDNMLGNTSQESLSALAWSEQQERFGSAKADALSAKCQRCQYRFVCNGGCPKNRFVAETEEPHAENYLCDGYQSFFGHIDAPMRFMAAELSAKRPPANIMAALAPSAKGQAATPRIGRNEACPCGTGRKYKRCHGA